MQDLNVKQKIISAVCEQLNIRLNSPEVFEIGDGNINRVFRLKDGDRSVVVKYAPESAVILPSIKLKRDRGFREGKYLSVANEISRGMTPAVYGYDKDSYILILEDMGEVRTISEALINGENDFFDAKKLACFTADTCFFTSGYAKESFTQLDKSVFDFSDLCLLTQQLVFEQPFEEHLNNHFSKENADLVRKFVYENRELKETVFRLKESFLNNHQALIHGDLHLASVFATEKDPVVFDGEFSYIGPIGFDIGNVLAHLFMTYFRRKVLSKTREREFDTLIIKRFVFEYINCFKDRFSFLMSTKGIDNCKNCLTVTDGIIKESYGFAGLECLRRVIGLAKSPIFTKAVTEDERAKIERCLIYAGVSLVTDETDLSSEDRVSLFCERNFDKGMKTI